jgi:hypothetical protein
LSKMKITITLIINSGTRWVALLVVCAKKATPDEVADESTKNPTLASTKGLL